MFIVLEGLDGAGKSTQVRKIREYFDSMGKPVEYLHFPRFDSPVYGGLIAEFLRGDFGPMEQVHPKLTALLFAEDRHGAAARIREWIAEGKTVLLDRYVYSNVAYQCAKLSSEDEAEALAEWIYDTEFRSFGIPKPDLNLFLDVPFSFVASSLSGARKGDDRVYLKGKSDIHEADMDFQRKVRKVYLSCTEKDPDFVKVDCSDHTGRMADPETIFARIRVKIDKML